MNSVDKKALKAGTWYTICAFVLKGMSFITMPLFTRILSAADVGMYSNLTSWITILSGIMTLDLHTSINLAHFQYRDDIYKYMSSIAVAGSVVTAIFYVGSIIFSEQITQLFGIPAYMLHVMLIYFLVNPAILILHAKFRVCLQYKQTIITSLIPAILSVVISLLATIMTDKNKLQARVIGYYGVWIVFAVVLYIYVLYKGKSVKIEYIKFAVPVSIPLVVHALANTLLSSSDRIMIQKICGPEYTAYYSIAYSCALVVSILWSAISQAWTPWCCEMMHQKMYATIRKVIRPVLLLFSAGVLMLIMIAPEILYILGGEEYMQAVYVIPPVMIGYIAQMLYTLYVNIEYYNRKQKQIMAGTLIAAAINIILNLIFIPIFGYIAAAYTTLVGYIVLLFVHYAFVRHMKLESIYDMKFNISLLLYAMACGIGISLLYNRVVIRWIMISIIICVFVIIVASKKNQIYKAIKEKDYIEMLKILHLMERE